ncbi:hypothetical protein ACQ2H7_003775 [Candidozyma auris]
MTEGPPDANQRPNTQSGTAIDEASSFVRWGKMIWDMLFEVCESLKGCNYPMSEELLEKANELAVYFTPLLNFTTITSQVASAVQRAATYSNKERVECLLEWRAVCLSKVARKCAYTENCIWIFCMFSERTECEIDETRKCYDYKLGGCLLDWQAEYLNRFAGGDLTQGCVLAAHLCALCYLITFLISDWWIISHRWAAIRQNDIHKDEQWALAMHLISLLLTLAGSVAVLFKLNGDPRRHFFCSALLLAMYHGLFLIIHCLHRRGYIIWRPLAAYEEVFRNHVQDIVQNYLQGNAQGNAQGNDQAIALVNLQGIIQDNAQDEGQGIVQVNAQDNVQDNVQGDAQGNVQGNEDERRTASADSADSTVSTGREHKGPLRKRRRLRKDSGNSQSQQAAASLMNSSLYEPRNADESNSENSKHEDQEDGGKLQSSETDSNLSRKKDGQSATNNESVELCTSEARNVVSKEQGENSNGGMDEN